ncbi:MAG TPA: mycofactocin-coupled SDR family oxidoreductase [Acidimicrobiales bacterium]|nr:mycofactocin-coupled SDR family oxidoreductase [Acidimicrobiales bacterium]
MPTASQPSSGARVAVVTGAARGIGAAVARRLAADGFALALGDVVEDDPSLAYALARPEQLEEVADSCRRVGAGVVAQRCDVRDAAEVERLVAAAEDRLGPLTAAVAVAAVLGGGGQAWELGDELIRRDLEVNYLGVVRLCRAAVPRLLAAENPAGGRVVAVVSTAGVTGLPRLASYAASKHAALGYIKSLAADLAGTGVTANAVLPGSTDTDLLRATADVYGIDDHSVFARHHRIGRLLDPEEVAEAVGWLCSGATSAVTGIALPVDGGFTG